MKLSEIFYEAMWAGLNKTPALRFDANLPKYLSDFILFQWQWAGLQHQNVEVIPSLPHFVFKSPPPKRYSLAIMFSGGIDSMVAAFWATHQLWYDPSEVVLVSVDYGSPYHHAETKSRKRLLEHIFKPMGFNVAEATFSNISVITPLRNGLVPVRNSMLASVGLEYSDTVWIIGNYIPRTGLISKLRGDKNSDFFEKISRVASLFIDKTCRISSPFLHLSKAGSIIWLVELLGKDKAIDLISQTVSCYAADGNICGQCPSCAAASTALWKAGLGAFAVDRYKGTKAGNIIEAHIRNGDPTDVSSTPPAARTLPELHEIP